MINNEIRKLANWATGGWIPLFSEQIIPNLCKEKVDFQVKTGNFSTSRIYDQTRLTMNAITSYPCSWSQSRIQDVSRPPLYAKTTVFLSPDIFNRGIRQYHLSKQCSIVMISCSSDFGFVRSAFIAICALIGQINLKRFWLVASV